MPTSTIAEVCRAIEQNDDFPIIKDGSPVKWFNISCHAVNEGVNVRLIFIGDGYFASCKTFEIQGDDDFTDVAVWRRLGRLINNIPTLRRLELRDRSSINAAAHPAVDCFQALYNELKNNNKIENLSIYPINQLHPSFDLAYFMQNNSNIKDLSLGAAGQLTPEQANIVATALAGVQLRSLDILC